MANTKVTGDLIAGLTIATGNIANNAITSDKISGITTAHITEGANLYYTDARARAAVSVSGNALSYNSSTGVITSNFEESPIFAGDVTISQPANGSDAILNLISKSTAGNSRTSSIEYDADNEYMYFKNAGATVATMTSGGNVGIGFSAPSRKLDVRDSSNTQNTILAYNQGASFTGTVYEAITDRAANAAFNLMNLKASTSSKFLVRGDGNVGIGTTSPDRQLEVYGVNDGYMKLDGGRAGNHGFTIGSDLAGFIIYDDTLGTYRFVIDQDSGNVGIGNTNPQSKLQVTTTGYDTGTTGFRLTHAEETNYVGYARLQTPSGDPIFSLGTIDGATTYETLSMKNGKVGIGTDSPQSKLHIQTEAAPTDIYLTDGTVGSDNYGGVVRGFSVAGQGGRLQLGTLDNDVYYPTITLLQQGGNVGIGTTSPTEKLHVEGRIRLGSTPVICSHDNIGIDIDQNNNSGSNYFRVTRDGESTELFRVQENGNVGIGTTTPIAKQHNVITSSGTALLLNNSLGGTGAYVDLDFNTYSIGGGFANAAASIRVIDDGAYSGNITFRTKGASIGASQTERMRITSAGNVGIGTTSPSSTHKLHIDEGSMLIEKNQLSGGTDHNFIQLAYNGGWSGNANGLAAINVTDGYPSNQTVGKFGITYDGSQGKYVLTNLYNGGYGASGDVFTVRANGTTYMAGNVGIGTTSPGAKLDVAGDITIQNGVYTYKTQGYTAGNSAINVDITVGNEGGGGNVFKIEAGFAHYYGMSYNSIGEWWCTSRGSTVINTYILNAGTTLGGTWSSSKPNTTTLRVTKSAGTYAGGGKWWIKVTYVPF